VESTIHQSSPCIQDRVTGEWSVMDTGWGQWIFEIFIEPAGVWFLVSIFCFISIVTTLHYVMRAMLRRASAVGTELSWHAMTAEHIHPSLPAPAPAPASAPISSPRD